MTELIDDRKTGLEIGWTATDWTHPIAFGDYAKAMEDWIIKTVVKDGLPIGAFYKKGEEIHFSIKPEWRGRWLTKKIKREVFDSGKVTTRVTPGHEYMMPILGRLGFKNDGTGLMVKEH